MQAKHFMQAKHHRKNSPRSGLPIAKISGIHYAAQAYANALSTFPGNLLDLVLSPSNIQHALETHPVTVVETNGTWQVIGGLRTYYLVRVALRLGSLPANAVIPANWIENATDEEIAEFAARDALVFCACYAPPDPKKVFLAVWQRHNQLKLAHLIKGLNSISALAAAWKTSRAAIRRLLSKVKPSAPLNTPEPTPHDFDFGAAARIFLEKIPDVRLEQHAEPRVRRRRQRQIR